MSLALSSKSVAARFSTLGARLTHLQFDGIDAIMGAGNDYDILRGDWTTGAVCGRIAGRITNSTFPLNGNNVVVDSVGPHQLHGGPDNFSLRHWDATPIDQGITFSLISPDGDQGYPGEVKATATYRLKDNVLSLDLEARTTKTTVINLTNHAYWNLIGNKGAFDHDVMIPADRMLPLNELLLPSGELRDVTGTRWDFRTARLVGEDYDNCWVLNGKRGTMKHGLTLRDPNSGRRMDVWTTEAGMQFYTSFHWNGVFPGKSGPLQQYGAIAIEPQNFPDAPNHANFPSAIVTPKDVYRNKMEWRFG